ncbi:MAG: hypothetical protein ACRDZX_17405 [Acidimicrobiales bacterium]
MSAPVAAVFAVALFCSACGASVRVRVDVSRRGAGTVRVAVVVPRSTAEQLVDLRAGLPVADLRRAGWSVLGPRPGPAGSTVVSASHRFSGLAQIPPLVADIAGAGPPGGRPFRLSVVEHKGFLEDHYLASGAVDLRCSLSCFDDPRLARTVGYALGLPAAQVRGLLGADPGRELSFQFRLLLPGHPAAAGRTAGGRSRPGVEVLTWAPSLGRSTTVGATTEVVNLSAVRDLVAAVSAAAFVVLTTAGYLLARRRRRRHRRRAQFTVTGRR